MHGAYTPPRLLRPLHIHPSRSPQVSDTDSTTGARTLEDMADNDTHDDAPTREDHDALLEALAHPRSVANPRRTRR